MAQIARDAEKCEIPASSFDGLRMTWSEFNGLNLMVNSSAVRRAHREAMGRIASCSLNNRINFFARAAVCLRAASLMLSPKASAFRQKSVNPLSGKPKHVVELCFVCVFTMSREVGFSGGAWTKKPGSAASKPCAVPRICPNRGLGSYGLQSKFRLQRIGNVSPSWIMIVTALVASLCACSVNKTSAARSMKPRL